MLGERGLERLARVNHSRAVELAEKLAKVPGVTVLNRHFFNEFTIRVPRRAATLIEALAERGVLGGLPVSRLEPERPDLADLIVVAATETTTRSDISTYATALEEVLR